MKRSLSPTQSQSNRILITENTYGIREFLSSSAPISGIIKHKFSDFHVHEVTRNGILHLLNVSFNAPKEKNAGGVRQEISLDTCMMVQGLVDGVVDGKAIFKILEEDKSNNQVVSGVIQGKLERQNFHQVIRKHLGSKFHTITNDDNSIAIKRGSDKSKKRKEKRSDAKQKPYCHFTLYKENKDTMDCLGTIARLLRINPKLLQFAGTKDKRAITTQRVCAKGINSEKFKQLHGKIQGVHLGDYSYEPHGLSLADSLGNHFVITIRDLDVESSIVQEAMDSLKTKGFINYFGMQRFGTRNVSTHEVGIAMLSNNWQKACDLVLAAKDDEKEEITAARKLWLDHKDCIKALESFPRFCTAERAILEAYLKHEKAGQKHNHVAAMQNIPKHLRLMYVHAYQSRVWNEMASRRISKLGLKLQVGDLATKESDNIKVVEVVTEDNFDNFDVYDVVLPLPGYDVKYPSNLIREDYVEYMGKDGFDPFNMKSRIHETNLPGAYRKLVCIPMDLSWYL